jgi:hypothetical protein
MSNSKDRLITIDDQIRQVLLRDWDPLRLRNDVVARDRYEPYVAAISQVLKGARSKEALLGILHRAKAKDFGLIDFPRTRNRIAARKLLEIKMSADDERSP